MLQTDSTSLSYILYVARDQAAPSTSEVATLSENELSLLQKDLEAKFSNRLRSFEVSTDELIRTLPTYAEEPDPVAEGDV
jgi:hypothetical protein